MNLTKRLIRYFLLSVLLMPINAFATSSQEALDILMNSTSITPDKTCILIYDLYTGNTIVSHNADTPIVPASVMKCVTTAALTNKTGYASRIDTRVYYTGRINGETLDGDIIVVGAGDPTLNSGRHAGEKNLVSEIIEILQKKGVSEITGKIKLDESYIAGPPTPAFWAEGDLSHSYATGFHAFNFESNSQGQSSVADPGGVFIGKLKNELENQGIVLHSEDIDDQLPRTLLMSHTSPMMSNIMRSCMFRSDNLYAEAFLRLFGKFNGTDGSTEDSAEAEMQYWETNGYPLHWVKIMDGSGLSRKNRLTGEFLGEVLGRKAVDPVYVSFFPLSGEEGTVKAFLSDTPLEGYMALKTGSMRGIQSYAGYKLDEDYEPTHVIVVMSNDLKDRDQFRKDLTSFFLSIFIPEEAD